MAGKIREIPDVAWPVMFALTLFSLSSLPKVPGPEIPFGDKVAHFGAYGVLATLVCRIRPDWRFAGWALLITAAYGATDEIHQYFVPGRQASLADLAADVLGAATAIVLYLSWSGYRRLLERPVRLWPGRPRDPVSANSA